MTSARSICWNSRGFGKGMVEEKRKTKITDIARKSFQKENGVWGEKSEECKVQMQKQIRKDA